MVLQTAAITEGCLPGTIRHRVLEFAKDMEGVQVLEQAPDPDNRETWLEAFVTNR